MRQWLESKRSLVKGAVGLGFGLFWGVAMAVLFLSTAAARNLAAVGTCEDEYCIIQCNGSNCFSVCVHKDGDECNTDPGLICGEPEHCE